MANMSFGGKAEHQSVYPVAVLKTWDRKELMRLYTHPWHNLLRWEERCEAMAGG